MAFRRASVVLPLNLYGKPVLDHRRLPSRNYHHAGEVLLGPKDECENPYSQIVITNYISELIRLFQKTNLDFIFLRKRLKSYLLLDNNN